MEPWIYIVLLGGVIVAIGMLRPRTQQITDSTEMRRNMEETLEHYMTELETENDKLLTVIERMKQEGEYRDEALRKRLDKLEQEWNTRWNNFQQAADSSIRASSVAKSSGIVLVDDNSKQQPVEGIHAEEENEQTAIDSNWIPAAAPDLLEANKIEESYAGDEIEPATQTNPQIQKRYAEIFKLFQNGWSEQAIAEKVGMPIGELQLIIRLGQQEGSHD
ncbi:hypothetical protein ABE142_19375 [Paenibacillus alvei]|uniref:hypothetical protein n=1 Tax=Paenibacillus alvei TaxID=44250 RepID=UPI0013DC633F|nr:hypothetical protein [Paenibacillus alvei]MBG9733195.1 hypothetical protein [Paenibacillus alvei]MBG9745245.1 hypothetical protein [Paenibacillus alvei]MCY9580610.1 hypothetical protein [Paenibacillus alvei]MCY9585093.1 hypothetical protein [Paenibacillus alvei]NEZ43153.1 hypothetical protein [Paenibacillus alvei]